MMEEKPLSQGCLWDDVKPGQLMGMVCTCPRCAVMTLSSTVVDFSKVDNVPYTFTS